MSQTSNRDELFDLLRLHAKGKFAQVRKAGDFDHDSPEIFRKWRDYMIWYALERNARSERPVSESVADEMGEQCALWFWNVYKPKAFYKEQARQQAVRYGRPIHEVIAAIVDSEDFG